MTQEEKKGVLEAIVAHYSADSRTDLAVEEMAELTKALLKHRRAAGEPERTLALMSVCEEMADVLIMIEQLKLVLHLNDDLIADWVDKKLARQMERMEKESGADA